MSDSQHMKYDQAKAIQPRNWLHGSTKTDYSFLNKERYPLKKIITKDINSSINYK